MFGPEWFVTGFESYLAAQLATPVNAAFSQGAGTLAAATYYYRVTAINARGETLASTETSQAIAASHGVNVNWGAVSGATGYRIYGRSTGAELFLAQVGAVTTFLDDGSLTPGGAMPTYNTTAQPIIPAGTAGMVLIAETQNIRYRLDAIVPTAGAGNGVLLKTTDQALPIVSRAIIAAMRVVEEVSGARYTAHYFGRSGPAG